MEEELDGMGETRIEEFTCLSSRTSEVY